MIIMGNSNLQLALGNSTNSFKINGNVKEVESDAEYKVESFLDEKKIDLPNLCYLIKRYQ